MGYPDTFQGFFIDDVNKWSDFKKKDFKPKQFRDTDIDILIDACGVCGSDVHSITGGWSDGKLPVGTEQGGLCAGHEVIGKAIKVGDKVTTVKVGDRVGVGAQVCYIFCSCRGT